MFEIRVIALVGYFVIQVSGKLPNIDFTVLEPGGASAETVDVDGYPVGVPGSRKAIDVDLQLLKDLCKKLDFEDICDKTGVHPAIIAAMISRETRGGRLLDENGGNIIPGDGYGLLQCDPTSGIDCQQHGPKSKEHVEQMMQHLVGLFDQVKAKFPDWTDAQVLQGAIAAYNFGIDNVQTWENLDQGTTNDDYSSDIIARAQWLIEHDKWKHCDELNGTGTVCGDPHHKTFDGITIDFEGPCTYIWSMYQGSVYPKFQVVARYEIHWTANWKIGELTTYYESNKITMSRRWISINKKKILDLPYNNPDGSFEIKQEGQFIVFESSNGIRVGYNRKWVGFVKIPKEYHGLVDGILGDSDGDANNDLRTREGTQVENNKYGHCLIGNSWQFDSKKRCSMDCEKPFIVNAP